MSEAQEKERRRIDAYSRELDADPQSLVFIALAEAHNRIGAFAEAAAVARLGLNHHPDSVAGRLALAVAEAGRQNLRDALDQIKAALIVDQENPRALALMGSLLLQKGLAKRAVQFLGHAVRLSPESREYEDLLRRAKRLSKSETSVQLPGAVADNPWTDENLEATEFLAGGDEHATVFAGLNGEETSKEAPEGGSSVAAAIDALERSQPLKALRLPGDAGGRPKVGGSAADYSQIMQRVPDVGTPSVHDEATEFAGQSLVASPVSAAAKSAVAPPKNGRASKLPPASEESTAKPSTKPTTAPKRPKDPPAADDVQAKGQGQKPPPPPEPTQKPNARPEPRPSRPAPAKVEAKLAQGKSGAAARAVAPGDFRPATMMVDDAIWALYGGEKPDQKTPAPEAKKKEPGRAAEAAQPAAPARRQVMVVRTSARLAKFAWVAVLFLLSAAIGVGAYALASSRSGPTTVTEAEQELRGIAVDLETGGLAALLGAEEAISTLVPRFPTLTAVLRGARAEARARIYRDFGGNPAMREGAEKDLAALGSQELTLESAAARVALSTPAATLRELEPLLKTYAKSPKALGLSAELAERAGRPEEALKLLKEARRLNPKRRETLHQLARWYAARKLYPAAFTYYDLLLDEYPEDVEVALERYVLGQISGQDPEASETESFLFGLVREERRRVAKDEAGRVALAFAVSRFHRGALESGLEELAKAEAAFDTSAEFKATLGALFIALGQWDRAEAQYARARELAPKEPKHELGFARAAFGRLADLRVPEAKDRNKPASELGRAELPFGVARYQPKRFALVEVDLRDDVFPEVRYRDALAGRLGPDRKVALEVANQLGLAARARRFERIDAARAALKAIPGREKFAPVAIEAGRIALASDRLDEAKSAFAAALKLDSASVEARIELGTLLVQKNENVQAMRVLEPLVTEGVIAPAAYRLLGELWLQKGDPEKARTLLESAYAVLPGDAAIALALGRLAHAKRLPDEAVKYYQSALESNASLETPPKRREASGKNPELRSAVDLYYLGRIVLEKNEKRGFLLLEASLDGKNAPPEVRFFIGKVLIKKGRSMKRRAKKELEAYRRAAPGGPFAAEALELLRR